MILKIQGNSEPVKVTKQIHLGLYRQWKQRLSLEDHRRINDALNEYTNKTGRGEIITTSWIPGTDWTGTAYYPIYEAVGQDWEMARFFFGLLVWNFMMTERPDFWSFGRYPRKEGEIIGLTYFRVTVG
jgi:hypothetical protein